MNQEDLDALYDAAIYVGRPVLGTMVFTVEAQVSLVVDDDTRVSLETYDVQFTHDKNTPKILIDGLEGHDFYTEFAPRWQRFRFSSETGTLIVSSPASDRGAYKITIDLQPSSARRGV